METITPHIAVIVAGGTGGHLYPGIATARALLQQPGWEAVFFVRKGDRGQELLQREGFRVFELTGQGYPRGLSLKMLTFPFKLLAGGAQAWSLLGRLKPQVVVGMGGYLSFPVVLAAKLRHVPTLIHEQNVLPGLANRFISPWVNSVAMSFKESQEHLKRPQVWLSGIPVRPEIGRISSAEARKRLDLEENKLTFLIFGGSQGAKRLNQAVVETWPYLSEWSAQYQVLHVTGELDYQVTRERYQEVPVKAVVMPYCHAMDAALAAADFVICRAGASTIAELIVAQRPSLLVPFPYASENHQFYNAEVLVKCGAAELIPEAQLTPAKLAERLRLYFRHPERLPQMRQRLETLSQELSLTGAADRLAQRITSLSCSHHLPTN